MNEFLGKQGKLFCSSYDNGIVYSSIVVRIFIYILFCGFRTGCSNVNWYWYYAYNYEKALFDWPKTLCTLKDT